MRTAKLACLLLTIAGPALAQPIFSRQGDGQVRNLTLSGGMYANPMERSAQALSPTSECAGNAGPNAATTSTGLAYGAVCVHVTPPTDSLGPLQTYVGQFGITVPAQAAQKSLPARDAVGLYVEGRFGAFGPAGWAENPLAEADKDASTTIISEFDLNNLSGCDSAGVDTSTTGGSAAFVGSRSDGLACPAKIGLLVTGVASNTSSAGLQFQYVSDGSHDMWQDGIKMLGGYSVAEYEWVSNTLAPTAFKIRGSHSYFGLGLESGSFGQSAISLSSAGSGNGKILWHCPDGGCAAGTGYPTSVSLYPKSDGGLHLGGAPFVIDSSLTDAGTVQLAASTGVGVNGLIVGTPAQTPTIMSGVYAPTGWSNYVSEWAVGSTQIAFLNQMGRFVLPAQSGGFYVAGAAQFAGSETHGGASSWSSLISASGGVSATNYILQQSGAYILDNSAGTASATIYYDQPNTAIELSAPGVEVSGGEKVGGNLSTAGSVTVGTAVVTDAIGPNGSGKIAFSGPIQLPAMAVAQLPSGCTAGEMAYAPDGRKAGEAAGAGSGVAVLCTRVGTAAVWAPITTATTAVAN